MKLNLGCGHAHIDDYVNVDKWPGCHPDFLWDLEEFPWPWPDGSIEAITFIHSLEHFCQQHSDHLKLWQEIYRILQPGGGVYIRVPHPASEEFLGDPTHVRPIKQCAFR